MPQKIVIQDGVPNVWASQSINVRQTNNVAAPTSEPRINSTDYVFVTVDNRGTTPIGCDCSLTGPFVVAGIAVSGSSTINVRTNSPNNNNTYIELISRQLKVFINSTGYTLAGLTSTQNASWGYSGDGRFVFVVINTASGMAGSGSATLNIYDVEGPTPGTPIPIYSGQPLASSGWGFGPDSKTFLFVDGLTGNVYNLLTKQRIVNFSTQGYAQWRFSPCGDLLALIGYNPPSTHNTVTFYNLKAGVLNQSYPATLNGMSVGGITVTQSNPTLEVIGQDKGGIRLTDMSRQLMDNPNCLLTTQGLLRVDAFHSMPTGNCSRGSVIAINSAFGWVGGGGSKILYMEWRHSLNKTLGHQCIITEAKGINGGDIPGDIDTIDRYCNNPDFQVAMRDHVAQRNVNVITPNSPRFIFPFTVQNFSNKKQISEISYEILKDPIKFLSNDPLLVNLPRQTFESSKIGFIDYQCGQDIKDDKVDEKLIIKLSPFETKNIALFFNHDLPANEMATQVVNIIETINGKIIGGITVAGTTQMAPVFGNPQEISNICPIQLTGQYGSSSDIIPPMKKSTLGNSFQPGNTKQWINVYLKNNGKKTLKDVRIYLESVSDIHIKPEALLYQIAEFNVREVFLARWELLLENAFFGEFEASIIVEDNNHNYNRLFVPIIVK